MRKWEINCYKCNAINCKNNDSCIKCGANPIGMRLSYKEIFKIIISGIFGSGNKISLAKLNKELSDFARPLGYDVIQVQSEFMTYSITAVPVLRFTFYAKRGKENAIHELYAENPGQALIKMKRSILNAETANSKSKYNDVII